ncbi:hypothetical protein BLS_004582 [Venturia inaequalis]|uniref:Uncharacterized protein n=1 Tax=Venturia inaequalis TaxID=5025 RepID=A0A8H3YW31_VENIN|nr:hypothetical protein BLS_004582 [Venturia inaequalis]
MRPTLIHAARIGFRPRNLSRFGTFAAATRPLAQAAPRPRDQLARPVSTQGYESAGRWEPRSARKPEPQRESDNVLDRPRGDVSVFDQLRQLQAMNAELEAMQRRASEQLQQVEAEPEQKFLGRDLSKNESTRSLQNKLESQNEIPIILAQLRGLGAWMAELEAKQDRAIEQPRTEMSVPPSKKVTPLKNAIDAKMETKAATTDAGNKVNCDLCSKDTDAQLRAQFRVQLVASPTNAKELLELLDSMENMETFGRLAVYCGVGVIICAILWYSMLYLKNVEVWVFTGE